MKIDQKTLELLEQVLGKENMVIEMDLVPLSIEQLYEIVHGRKMEKEKIY